MNGFFNGIADLFNAMFKILPFIGGLANVLFIVAGSVATFIWIRYMVKSEKEEKGFNH